jgi:pimeloyl-ACP methyl ester carboxylesterase
METAFARNGQVELAYQAFGEPGGAPLLLMSGLDYQMVWWPEALCTALAGRGFQVVRFDYRDSGLSTHLTTPVGGGPWRALLTGARRPPYRGQDMAADVLAVLDALGWDSGHLLGVSMGAGLAQLTAVLSPDRVRTLTLVSGIPMGGNPLRMLPYLHLSTFAKLATRRYGAGRAEQERMLVDVLRATCTAAYPLDEDWARRTAAESYDRHPPDPAARQRQLAAGRATKIRRSALRHITAPTLVIHGEADPLVRPAASRALARAIPGARLVTYPGMGHGLAPGLWPAVLDEIAALTGPGPRPAHSRPAAAASQHSGTPGRSSSGPRA